MSGADPKVLKRHKKTLSRRAMGSFGRLVRCTSAHDTRRGEPPHCARCTNGFAAPHRCREAHLSRARIRGCTPGVDTTMAPFVRRARITTTEVSARPPRGKSGQTGNRPVPHDTKCQRSAAGRTSAIRVARACTHARGDYQTIPGQRDRPHATGMGTCPCHPEPARSSGRRWPASGQWVCSRPWRQRRQTRRPRGGPNPHHRIRFSKSRRGCAAIPMNRGVSRPARPDHSTRTAGEKLAECS